MFFNNLLLFFHAKLIPLTISIVGFGFLIIIHELGHFLFCKLFGVHTPTFSIGFGPKIIEKKIGATNFRLSAIPFGGYVEMAGNAEIGQGDQIHAQAVGENSFASKAYWQKMLIMLGGIIFNLLSAYVIFCILFLIGSDSSKITIVNIADNSAAQKSGLRAGDQLIKINDHSLVPDKGDSFKEKYLTLLNEITSNPNKEITLTIERNKEIITLPCVLGTKEKNDTTIGSLGAGFNPSPIPKLPFNEALVASIRHTNEQIVTIAQGIKNMFAQRSLEGAGGPIAIAAIGFKTAQAGLIHLFIFLASMSITLALFNLLPLGVLDGGQLLFVTIEAIIRRPTPDWFKIGVNIISILIFAALFLYLTYKDIVNVFGKPIHALVQKIMMLFGRV